MPTSPEKIPTLLQLPAELLVRILSIVSPPLCNLSVSTAVYCRVPAALMNFSAVSRACHQIAQPVIYRTFLLKGDDKPCVLDSQVYQEHMVSIRGLGVLLHRPQLMRHVRQFRGYAVECRAAEALVLFDSASFWATVEATYSASFCVFLRGLVDRTRDRSAGDMLLGHDLLHVFVLTLMPGVTMLAVPVVKSFKDGPLSEFFTFCGQARKRPTLDWLPESAARREESPDGVVSFPNVSAPLSRLRDLEVRKSTGGNWMDVAFIAPILFFPDIRSCSVTMLPWHPFHLATGGDAPRRATTSGIESGFYNALDDGGHNGEHATVDVNHSMKSLKLFRTAIPRFPLPGGAAALSVALYRFPNLEVLQLHAHSARGRGHNHHTRLHDDVDFGGLGRALRNGHCSRRLRRLDIVPNSPQSYANRNYYREETQRLCDGNLIGNLRHDLAFASVEQLRLPLGRLVCLRQQHQYKNQQDDAGPEDGASWARCAVVRNLGDVLPRSLRYLWLKLYGQDGTLGAHAMTAMLWTAAAAAAVTGSSSGGHMPDLEWMLLELHPDCSFFSGTWDDEDDDGPSTRNLMDDAAEVIAGPGYKAGRDDLFGAFSREFLCHGSAILFRRTVHPSGEWHNQLGPDDYPNGWENNLRR